MRLIYSASFFNAAVVSLFNQHTSAHQNISIFEG